MFAPGLGTPFIEEAATPGRSGDLNNATSTKQPLTCATGIVVLATNDTTKHYWHNYEAISGCDGTSPTAPATSTPPTANPRRVSLPLVNR